MFEKYKADIIFIQETHITEDQTNFIEENFDKKNIKAIIINKTINQMKTDYINKRMNKIQNNLLIDENERRKKINEINPNFYKKSGGLMSLFRKDISFLFEHKSDSTIRSIVSTAKDKKKWYSLIYTHQQII